MLRRTHSAPQWAFLRLENACNRLFGEALNPLYYLGALAFFMFWIVLASGLYLYAFFKTGVGETYASVESLTHDQWYLGGVLRSLHRYASDALVLLMGIHMLRHFAFGRYRGFRWFSWATGVLLLWLVYASGVNGYMLPWDRLAQFVATATAEWFDALPIFAEPLARNFAFRGAVNDRLFSLLSFLHIGIPLMVLLFMWVHTQRVPGAETNPPRTMAAAALAALLVLSLVKPALSQEPADLGTAVTRIGFDWFYLPVYALLDVWSAGWVWALVAGATFALFLLPWLPPRFKRGGAAQYAITLRPSNRSFTAQPGETVLEAALRQGLLLPFECRNGGCGVCKATLLHGQVDYGAYQERALSEAEKRRGKALLCCATPLSDLDVECEVTGLASEFPVRVYTARVHSLEKRAPDVMVVRLRLPEGEKLEFRAGQYLNVLLEGGARRSFSFATAPHDSEFVELHVRHIPGGRFTARVFAEMKAGDILRFEAPLGSFVLQEASSKPIIFVAGATGFAPVKSMLEYAFHVGIKRRMYLYWGVRSRRDLYLAELPERWQREHENFIFVPVLSDPRPEDRWQGRTGLVHEAILQDFKDLSGYEIYACGSVRMVETARPSFLGKGLAEDACFSDAFTPSPQAAGP